MRAPLPALVITVKVIELQKSLLDLWKFFRPFLNTLSANDTYSLNSKDKWMQTIQMHLAKKQNIFSKYFSAFFQSALNFKHFQKKRWPSYLMYFRNYRPRKTCLDKCLKTPVWEDLSTSDMVNSPKHWFNLNESAFTSSRITLKVIELQKSLLDWWKFFKPFLNTLTANDKYSLNSKYKWMQTIQMHLSQKQNVFSQFFFGRFSTLH